MVVGTGRDRISMKAKITGQVGTNFDENIAQMEKILPVKESFDIIRRDITVAGKRAVFFFIDGFTKDETMLKIMDSMFRITKDQMPQDATAFSRQFIPYVEVDIVKDYDAVVRNVLSGMSCLFLEGFEVCIAIDCRTYPARGVDEPDKDKSLRGSRDGFVETVVFNTALIRRRIRDPHLVMEMVEAGEASRTDIPICYMSDRIEPEMDWILPE